MSDETLGLVLFAIFGALVIWGVVGKGSLAQAVRDMFEADDGEDGG